MTLAYSQIDQAHLGPSLESPDGQVLTVNAINTTLSRHARGTLGKTNGVWYFEVCFYANNQINGAPISLAGLGSVGIATSSAALNKYVGEDANGIGYKVGDGGVFTSAVAITGTTPAGGTTSVTLDAAHVPATNLQLWVGVLLDLTALTVTFSVNGSVYAVAPVPSGKTWFPAISVCGPALSAYAINAFLNTGQRAFNNSQSAGWYSIASAQPLSLYLTADYEGGYTSANSDSPQNQIYAPRALNADGLTIANACTVWIWGQSGASATYGSLTIDNFDGAYDFLLSGDYRDTQVAFKQIPGGGTLAQAVTLAKVLIDTVYPGGGSSVGSASTSATNEQTITINFKSVMATLQKPLQRKLFPPFADPGVANAPLPITLGACRNITPLLRTTDTAVPGHLHYQIHDAQITAIATVRDKGAPLDPNASPPQYGPDSAPGQIYLATSPVGALTCDASSMGGQVIVPGIADVLAGAGGFPTASWGAAGSPPPGFAIMASPPAGSSVQQMGGTYGGSANQMRMALGAYVPWDPANSKYGYHLHSGTAYLQGGNTYIITAKIYNVQGQTVYLGQPTFGVVLSASTSATVVDGSPAASITPYNQPINTTEFASQTVSFVYTCPQGAARYLFIHMCSGMGGTQGAFGTISSIVAEQVGAYNAQQQLPLVPITLSDYVREIAARAGLTSAQVSTADTDAITSTMAAAGKAHNPPLDWSKGYAIGEHFSASVNCDTALQAPLDSLCAVAFPDAAGVIRFRQLVDPITSLLAGTAVAANFDLTNTQYGVACEVAYAPGLTTQMGSRRNYKQLANTDTVSDYVTLPGYLRTQFARLSQFIAATKITLANAFSGALSLAPLDSCLDDPTQAQYEIDRVCTPHAASRVDSAGNPLLPRFVTFTICYDGVPPINASTGLPLMFGDIVTVNYPRYGLGPVSLATGTTLAGTPFVVKDTTLMPGLQTLTLTVWG